MTNLNNQNIRELPTIPLRGVSVFPGSVTHFDVGREKSIKALEIAMVSEQTIFLTTQKDPDVDQPGPDDYYNIGTVAEVKQMLRMPGEIMRVLVEGRSRAKILEILQESPYLNCEVEYCTDEYATEDMAELEALSRSLLDAFAEYITMEGAFGQEILNTLDSMTDLSSMADFIADNVGFRQEQKQELLETVDVCQRVETLLGFLNEEIEIAKIENDISQKVRGQLNKSQKEYYLREQLRVIQEELGQEENVDAEVEKYLKQLKELNLPEAIHEKIENEINRLYKVQLSSAEGGVIRTYADWVLALPWNTVTEDNMDLTRAEKILEEDHYGLEKVKERILEYLAVKQLAEGLKGPILCLVGPPGVGKTSIARSVARAMDRNFVRMSLGGVRDEAEIRGHRKTYIGSMPGRIISAIRDAKSANPVFLFDEVDKIGADYRGDPASALLEVLDPEQNKEFTDHFLEVPFDLSRVMFITTANTTETIPRPLLDRMEVIEVSGYTEEEKLQIAKKYIIPKKLKEHGMNRKQLKFSEGALRDIINYYTRESGVRNMEREITSVCRKAARKIVQDEQTAVSVTQRNLTDFLGKHRFLYDKIEKEPEVGMVTGMAWTTVGGETLTIEVSVMDGTGKISLTGQLGDVMQESAKAGLSYIRTHAVELGIDPNFYKEKDVHIHIPEGAIPKDGPSAGISMCTAVVSALTKIPVRNDLAMTGEITLRGKVLPIGGVKEKVLAAHRAGIRTVILPKENERDIEDIPENVRKHLEFKLVDTVGPVLETALVK
ncbi:MAG: endopeptidase La [Firmicutes bacterium]|nr:endopeptidase La [Bacillota bacterium]MBR2575915.1 endopeptidase La [Bacillota bacterium]